MLLCLLLCMSNNECYVSGPITRIVMIYYECCVSGPITRIVMSVTLFTTLRE